MTSRVKLVAVPLILGAAVLSAYFAAGLRAAENGRVVPPPAIDEQPAGPTTETAVFAGGCFWGVQGVFQHVKGVTRAVSGYAGGEKATAEYEMVGSGTTGHAESVQVTYDPHQVTYGRLLQVYFSVAHDPTELNRQGPDYGTQYRSAIFPMSADQARVAKAYLAQLDASRAFPSKVVTKIESGATFYPAEAYHQDFLERHPTYPYIVFNDLPKVRELERLFPDLYRKDPVLVNAAR